MSLLLPQARLAAREVRELNPQICWWMAAHSMFEGGVAAAVRRIVLSKH
jgi:hypothetical protein